MGYHGAAGGTGNENSAKPPRKNDAMNPGPSAAPAETEYFHNVAAQYIHTQDLAVNHENANERSHEGGGMGSTDPLNCESITIDHADANPSGADAKASAGNYHNPPGANWRPGDGRGA